VLYAAQKVKSANFYDTNVFFVHLDVSSIETNALNKSLVFGFFVFLENRTKKKVTPLEQLKRLL